VNAAPIIGFVLIAALAIAFAAVPLFLIEKKKSRAALLLAAVALLILGIGGGTYYILGRPHLAQREAKGLNTNDVNALIPYLIQRVRQYPQDVQAWRYLGQAYMEARDPRDAAKALAKAIALTGDKDAALNLSYGEALTLDSGGAVTPEAETAFKNALAVEPRNVVARFFVGLARAQHNDRPAAITIWQNLLADVPVTDPMHQLLVDRLAILTSQAMAGGKGTAPNPRAMVDMLAARLKADPNDALGWVRLMRAYTVLGETAKAKEALATARKTFADNKDAQTAFTTAAKALKLE
jgi:cytochrome c-type biogenesis protein CcmH